MNEKVKRDLGLYKWLKWQIYDTYDEYWITNVPVYDFIFIIYKLNIVSISEASWAWLKILVEGL